MAWVVLLDRTFVALVGFGVYYAGAALLGTELFGLFLIAETLRVGAMSIGDTPIGQALVHYGAARPSERDGVIRGALILKSLVLVVIAAISWTVAASGLVGAQLSSICIFLPLWVVMSMVLTTAQQILVSSRSFGRLASMDAVMALGVVVSFLLLGAVGAATPIRVMFAIAAARSLAGGSVLVLAVFRGAKASSGQIDLLRSYSVAAAGNAAASFVNLRADALLIAMFAGLTQAASWGVALPIMSVYMLIGEAANLELLPAVSAVIARDRRDSITRLVKRSLILWMFPAMAFSAAVFLVPVEEWLATLDQVWLSSIPAARILALAGPLIVLGRIAASVNNGVGMPGNNTRATLAGLIVKLTAGSMAIWLYGTTGAAVIVVVVTAVVATVAVYYAIIASRDTSLGMRF